MRTRTVIATAAAAGLLGAGLVGVPAVLAADDPSPAPGPRWDRGGGGGMMWGPRWDDDDHPMMGGRGPGNGRWDGRGGRSCAGLFGGAASGTLTAAQEQTLARDAEDEKLAHDVYVALAASTGDPRFERVAWSESQHLRALRTLMNRYDVADPTAGQDAGEFASDAVQQRYDDYVSDGSGSLDEALEVARAIERADIASLEKAAADVDAPDVKRVYLHLARASEHHLAAFSR